MKLTSGKGCVQRGMLKLGEMGHNQCLLLFFIPSCQHPADAAAGHYELQNKNWNSSFYLFMFTEDEVIDPKSRSLGSKHARYSATFTFTFFRSFLA